MPRRPDILSDAGTYTEANEARYWVLDHTRVFAYAEGVDYSVPALEFRKIFSRYFCGLIPTIALKSRLKLAGLL